MNNFTFVNFGFLVVYVDFQMRVFYNSVNNYWKVHRQGSLSHLNVISLAGGINDKLVRSDLAFLPEDYRNDFSYISTSVEDVWASADHLCIVWCRQLVIKLTRILFDLLDKTSGKLTTDEMKRIAIINYHLKERKRERFYPTYIVPQQLHYSLKGEWLEHKSRMLRFQKSKVSKLYVNFKMIKFYLNSC